MTDLILVSKFKFASYSQVKKIALYVPRFNSYSPPKSGVSDFQIETFLDGGGHKEKKLTNCPFALSLPKTPILRGGQPIF